jgi:hypothetical protein
MRRSGGGWAAAAALVVLVEAAAAAAGPVPRPFEPLRVREEAGAVEVALWGRSYRFGAGPLPSEVRSQGIALFAEHPRFRVAGAEGEQDVVWQTPTLVEALPEVVRLRSLGTLPGLRVQAETRLEYDGMIAVDLELQAEQPVRLLRLDYEVALTSSAMRFFARHLPYDYQVANVDKRRLLDSAGLLPDRLALAFVPTLALGDRRVGVEWWSETDAHWREGPGARPFEVVRSGAVTRLRVTPIGAPLVLERGSSWRDAFAFFVFPSRPPPERWRSVRFLPYARASRFDKGIGTRFMFLATQSTFHAQYDGLPAALPDSFQRELRAELERLHVGYMPYGMLTLAPILHPRTMSQFQEWSAEGKWWRIHKGYENPVIRRNRPELGSGAPYTYPVCAARKDYFDWMLGQVVETLVAERLDALYFDHGAITRMCVRNPILKGKRGAESWEYRNVREFYKRLYEQVQERRPGALIAIHTHGAPKALGAFVDFHIFGEALNAHFGGGRPSSVYFSNPQLYTPDYLALPDGYLDAQLFPPVGGVASVIPQIKWALDPAKRERVRGFQRAFQALVLSNDVHAPLWVSDLDTADEIYRAVDRFGDIGSAVVHPWWENGAAIRRPDGLRATAWVRDGRALLVLANLGGIELKGRVELDREALAIAGVQRVRDLERPDAKASAIDRGGFAVTVPPRDLRILALE